MARYQNIEPFLILKEPAQVLKNFQALLSRLNVALEEDALLEDFGSDVACSSHNDMDAAWRRVAKDAADVRDGHSTGALLPLRRMAGLIARRGSHRFS